VNEINFYVQFSGLTDNLPTGYLFLCPLAELQAEVPTCFRIPDQPAYWSLDSSGVDRLSDEAAEDLGFPGIQSQLRAVVMSWDVSVYGGIRKFQKTKGFDPYSQEAALELGYPLFHLSCDRDALFAHSTHIELCIYAAASHGLTVHQSANGDCYRDSNGVSYTEDCSEDEDEQYGCAVDCQTMNSITHHLKCRFGQLRAWEHFPGSECSE
jgi:hypothetical protein